MIDPDELDAIAEAVFARDDETFSLPVAPGFVLELAYDGCGLFAATWRAGSWWRVVESGRRDALPRGRGKPRGTTHTHSGTP